MFAAVYLGHQGCAASRDQHIFGRVAHAAYFYRVAVNYLCPAGNQLYSCVIEQIQINAVKSGNFFGAIGFQQIPIKARFFSHAPAKAVRLFERFGIVRRVAIQFLGNAAKVDTSASQSAALNQGNPRPSLCCHARGTYATAAASYHQ